MGLFVVDISANPTVETKLKAALANIELFLDHTNGQYKDEFGQTPHMYLIESFAKGLIEDALKTYKGEQHV